VQGCITMREDSQGKPKETWNDRVQQGRDVVPGGLDASAAARAARSGDSGS
jgi:dihydropyrimidine dehydrogenase (NAD+) subunit PreA